MSSDDLMYSALWVLLAYFFAIVLFFTGWLDGNQVHIYYGLYFFLIGLGFNISAKLSFIVDVLTGADVKYEWLDEEE